MSRTIRIVIADDHELFVEGIKMLLSANSRFIVSASVNTGRELLNYLESEIADVVLLDINMPDMNGLDTLRFLRNSNTKIKIIMLSTYKEKHLIENARALGANGYLLKTFSSGKVAEIIEMIYLGQDYFVIDETKSLPLNKSKGQFFGEVYLTKRELELLKYIKEDLTNLKIANTLNLSIYTIETHRKNIMQKLGLRTRAALMRFIISNNI